MALKYISLFSGIEAATVAWRDLSLEPVAFCEIDKFPSAVLAQHFPDIPNLGDITKINWGEVIEEHGAIDLIVGGSPCQSFSLAGGREGLDGESNLMFEYIRAIRDVRPKWLLWENVPGVLSVRDNAFSQLLEELQKLGYCLSWRCLDAQYFGVAQRRKRVFLVGYFGTGGCASAVLFDRDSVCGNTVTYSAKRKQLTRRSEGHDQEKRPRAFMLKIRGGSKTYVKRDGKIGTAGKGALASEELAFTIATSQDQTLIDTYEDCVRKLTPRELERLQGFPDDWTLIPWNGKPAGECPDVLRIKAIGNSMAVPVMKWLGERMQMADEMMRGEHE